MHPVASPPNPAMEEKGGQNSHCIESIHLYFTEFQTYDQFQLYVNFMLPRIVLYYLQLLLVTGQLNSLWFNFTTFLQ